MIIKSKAELQRYQKLANLSTKILKQLREAIKPGVTPLKIDQLAGKLCAENKVRPTFKGVKGHQNRYQYATCISVNDAVVHGIPDKRPFEVGDIVKVDFGIKGAGLVTDHCFTVGVKQLSKQDELLVRTCKNAVQKAVKKAVVGNTAGDLGQAIESTAARAGLSVVREFVGHGIGRQLHEDPQLPAYGKSGRGQQLQKGMVLCVEAQLVAGNNKIYFTDDGWTVKTQDGRHAAMFEYMVIVGAKKATVLTDTLNWPIIA